MCEGCGYRKSMFPLFFQVPIPMLSHVVLRQDLRVKVSKSPFYLTFYFQAAVKVCDLEQGVLDTVQTTFC